MIEGFWPEAGPDWLPHDKGTAGQLAFDPAGDGLVFVSDGDDWRVLGHIQSALAMPIIRNPSNLLFITETS